MNGNGQCGHQDLRAKDCRHPLGPGPRTEKWGLLPRHCLLVTLGSQHSSFRQSSSSGVSQRPSSKVRTTGVPSAVEGSWSPARPYLIGGRNFLVAVARVALSSARAAPASGAEAAPWVPQVRLWARAQEPSSSLGLTWIPKHVRCTLPVSSPKGANGLGLQLNSFRLAHVAVCFRFTVSPLFDLTAILRIYSAK